MPIVFVPGRLCILGEHTDWAGGYRDSNPSVAVGVTIVCATNEGLYANYKEVDNQRIEFTGNIKDDSQQNFSCPLDINALKQQAQSGSYFCYVAGTAAAVLESKHFKFRNSLNADYKGILIDNYETSLPMKKGLSSSAAVCVLVAKCFSDIYSLNMSHAELMEIAYLGEKMTSSECGRMDQCVVMGKNSIGVMRFDGSSCELVKLKCKTSLYFVVVDLKAGKDTVVILRDLNACFTGEMNENKMLMHQYVKRNCDEIAPRAVSAIIAGNVTELAVCMKEAQEDFDHSAIPNCPKQLSSPKLHSLINDDELKSISLAVKGIGSQGDGSAQILCESENLQNKVVEFVVNKYRMDAFKLTLPADEDSKESGSKVAFV